MWTCALPRGSSAITTSSCKKLAPCGFSKQQAQLYSNSYSSCTWPSVCFVMCYSPETKSCASFVKRTSEAVLRFLGARMRDIYWNLCILPNTKKETFSPWWCMDAGNFGTENCWSNLKFMLLAEKSFPTFPLNLKSKQHEQPSDAIRLCPPVWHQARSLEHPKIQRETRSLLKISRHTPVYSHNTTVYSQQFSSICSSAPQKKWHPPLDGLTNVWKRNNHLHQSFTRSYFVKANLALIYFQNSNFHASCQGIWAFLRRPCAWHPSTCAGWVRDFESLWNNGCFH